MPEVYAHEDKNAEEHAVNDWIVVIFDNKWYPGVIMEVNNEFLVTKFTTGNKKVWSWPKNPDMQNILPVQVLCKISTPKPGTKKDTFTLSNQEYKIIQNNFEN